MSEPTPTAASGATAAPDGTTAAVATEDLRALAVAAAGAAGEVLLRHQAARRRGEQLAVTTKSSATDPVTEADRAAERAVLGVITAARPDDGVLGEEGQGDVEGTTGLRWVVDPLDGTVNFLQHIPQWSVSVAIEDDHGLLVGVVLHPDLGERHVAVRGDGAVTERADGTRRRLQVAAPTGLDRTIVGTGYHYDPDLRAAQGPWVGAWTSQVRDLRRLGSAALDLAFVAAGRLDGYAEVGLNRWDWAAGQLLVTEAGGAVEHVPMAVAGQDRTCVVAGSRATVDRLRELVTATVPDGPG